MQTHSSSLSPFVPGSLCLHSSSLLPSLLLEYIQFSIQRVENNASVLRDTIPPGRHHRGHACETQQFQQCWSWNDCPRPTCSYPPPRRVCARSAFTVVGVWMAGEPCRLLGAAGMCFFMEGQDEGAGGTLRTTGAPGSVSGPGPGAMLTHLLISPLPNPPHPKTTHVPHAGEGPRPPGHGPQRGRCAAWLWGSPRLLPLLHVCWLDSVRKTLTRVSA